MKSFLAVLAGLAFILIVTTVVDVLLYYFGVFQIGTMTAGHWAAALAYRIVIAIFGGWLTAKLAPSNPMKHALILGGIGTVIAIIGAVFTWDRGAEFGPHWYPIALVVTALPCTWLGGKLASGPVSSPAA